MKTNCTTVKEVAEDIAKCLRENPESWGQGRCYHSLTDLPCCLLGQIGARCGMVPALVGGNSALFFDTTEAYKPVVKTTMLSMWNDNFIRRVQDVIDVSEKVAANAN
jgi:hypothetical protein